MVPPNLVARMDMLQRRNAPRRFDGDVHAALSELRRHLPIAAEHARAIRRLDFRPCGARDAPYGHPRVAAVGERVERRVGAEGHSHIPSRLDWVNPYNPSAPAMRAIWVAIRPIAPSPKTAT